jgi:hypothetical protein
MGMRFGTWNIRNLYKVGTLMRVSRDLSRYSLDLGGVQEGSSTASAGEYTFFYKRGMSTMNWVQGFCT